ncbi:MAG: bifunctional 4-hydroxy-2-oxoglutarate aldolase/2-dehydro-3-deoxy-phosphogluconate aldolase [Alphaproteobacteria bacterium]
MSEVFRGRPIIPVIEIEDAANAVPLAGALLKGGIDIIEITFRTDAGALAIDRIAKECPDMVVGAGTVVTEEQARRAIDLGVDFGVSPGFSSTTVDFFRKNNIEMLPGVQTPTEIQLALEAGCSMMKFFPAGPAGGVGMLKALSGPYASLGVTFCPTGGVSLDNLVEYLSLPAVKAVGGSWIATKKQIAGGEWDVIARQAAEALAKAAEAA